ncbi:hypothetical protein EFP_065 [Enterococcus phage EF24C]|uniref:Uncharacterized protein n=2 Tax=Kochikohdavirus TaxID=2560160 RepID=A8E2B7_BPPHE|nr:hypothetical protein EFP_gp065 [Enterococcus phage EF24C]WDQ27700.1 hypothetical protein EF53_068 [Enterococcus phage 53]BAF81333.1 hypothetical protein EFP_065 [Enterococcus phage EF24C]
MRKGLAPNPFFEILEKHQDSSKRTMTMNNSGTPSSLQPIRDMFLKAMKEGKRVLIENSDLSSANSVVIEIEYVGNRWCLGYQRVLFYGMELKIPHTIHFCDVYGAYGHDAQKVKRQVKVVFEGDNPFE